MKRLLLLSGLLCLSIAAFAQNGPRINVQGILKNIKDVTVEDGTYELTFRLYPQEENGTAVFEEIADVEVVGGIYTYKLGSINNLSPSIFGETLYLGITVNGKELEPRGELTYAPYAMAVNTAIYAVNADTADYVRFGMIGGSDCSGRIGDVKYSVLPLAEFQTQNGDCWRLMDGSALPAGNALRDLTTWENIPDARGVFLRANDERSTGRRDPDRTAATAIATLQAGAFASHRHSGSVTTTFQNGNLGTPQGYASGSNLTLSTGSVGVTIANTGGSETRPVNLNLYLYIRVE